ncbi:MAG: hypothetical protein Q8R85_18845 [Bosea sp. (in: a-proteobacteria)]|nr:hypothetical protein [Bosea sp. (in: a-proteobacteria)]
MNGFNISWAAKRKAFGTLTSVYILTPERFMSETFGFDLGVALFIFDYDTTQPRQFQAIDLILQEKPLLGRVDPSIYFIVHSDKDGNAWIRDYISVTMPSRHPIAIYASDLLKTKDDWSLRNKIAESTYIRDIFDSKLPLIDDMYFFGRDSIVKESIDSIRKIQNIGMFGLRKTGKTSILYKIKRDCEKNKIARVVYFDCKSPSIRKLTGTELLQRITGEIKSIFNVTVKTGSNPYLDFENVVAAINKKEKFCIIFDEIEYISHLSQTDPH